MLCKGWVVDVRAGGLVLGRSHADGDIFMLQECEDRYFHVIGKMQGGEYILTNQACLAKREEIENINQSKLSNQPISIECSELSRVFNTNSEPDDKFVWIDTNGQYIINKISTSHHIQRLEETIIGVR